MMEYTLNIGDLRVTKNEAVTFTCLGLGSCIGLFLQDRTTGIAGGAHILLPESTSPDTSKFYCVKRAVDELIHQFKINGSTATTLRAKITGGANVIATSCQTGKRNTANVLHELLKHRVYIAAMDVGGETSRSAKFNCQTGTLTIRFPETNEYKIC